MTDPIREEPTLVERLRHVRRRRTEPTSLARYVLAGLARLLLVVAIASGIALGIDALSSRNDSFGFYLVGAIVLVGALAVSGATPRMYGTGMPRSYVSGDREYRVSMAFAYMLAGAIVVGIGVAIEVLTR